MKVQDFFDKYNGKGIDYDGFYGFQCVDLYRQYVKECLGLSQSPAVAGAVKIWDTYLTKYFDRITNQPNNAPILGDIIIWGQGVGQYGHVAICSSASVMNFVSFDQNWPVGSLCHLQNHNYKYVLGWLRVKPQLAPVVIAPSVSPTPTVVITDKPVVTVEVPIESTTASPSVPEPVIPPETPNPTPNPTIPAKSSFLSRFISWILHLFK